MDFGFPSNLANRIEVAYFNLTYIMARIKQASTGIHLKPAVVLKEVKKARAALDRLEAEALVVQAEQQAYAKAVADQRKRDDRDRAREQARNAAQAAKLDQFSRTPAGANVIGLVPKSNAA